MPWLQNYGTAVSWFDMTRHLVDSEDWREDSRLKEELLRWVAEAKHTQHHTTEVSRQFDASWFHTTSCPSHSPARWWSVSSSPKAFIPAHAQQVTSHSPPQLPTQTGALALSTKMPGTVWRFRDMLSCEGSLKLKVWHELRAELLVWGKWHHQMLGFPPIGSEDSLSSFKSHVCRSRQERSKGGLYAQPQKIQVSVVSPPPTPPVTTLMKQKTVKKTSTPGQPCNWSNWNGNLDGLFASKTWQIRSTP